MAQYNVYGIGNALVDMEFEVTDDFLTKMNIEKGLMTLVDEGRQGELIENLDGVQHKRSCGGSAANTVIAVSQLGGKAFYSCKVAQDETGDFYYSDLQSNGVKTNLELQEREDGVTGKCMVLVTSDAERTMNTHLGITETFARDQLVVEELKAAEFLYIEGYLVTSPTGRDAAIYAKQIAEDSGVKTAMTFSDPAMAKYFAEGLKEILGDKGVDLLFCNEEEALTFTGKTNFEEATQELKKYAKMLAITQGSRGAYLWDGQKEIDIVASKVEPVDTNGAGDLFAGAFLYGITHELGFAASGKLACACASRLVTQFGPRLKREQTEQIKAEITGK